MKFTKITPGPGFVRDPTAYASEGHWYDGDKVRFRYGFAETIGGWAKFVTASVLGIGRYLRDWMTVSGSKYLAVGTTYKLYVNEGASMMDITSIRSIVVLSANPFASVNASGVITVTHVDHGAVQGDYVTYVSAASFAGIDAGVLNVEHRINAVPDADSYKILVPTAATSSTSGGGSTVSASYQENTGLDTYIAGGSGWGVGGWGSGPWSGVRVIDDTGQLRLWSMDNYGDDLIATIRAGATMYWDESGGVASRAIRLSELLRKIVSLDASPIATTNTSTTLTVTDDLGHDLGVGDEVLISGAAATNGVPATEINTSQTVTGTPTETTFEFSVTTAATSTGTGGGSSVTATYYAGSYYGPDGSLAVLVSDQSRHAICLGTTPIGSSVIDPLLIRWSESEDASVWRPKLENLAGGKKLSSGSIILAAVKTRQEIVVWTDTSIHSMRYIGAPFVYSFSELAPDVAMMSPQAWAATGDSIYFMGRGGFYKYSGSLAELQCPVEDYVFSDLDIGQAHKVCCGSNNDFGEVIWFYPSNSDDTGENSRYVVYNHRENHWSFGTMNRAYWSEATTRTKPQATTVTGGVAGTDPVYVTNTTGSIVVTYTAHGMAVGDTVILNGSSAVGGIPVGAINAQHTTTAVTDNTFTFVVPDVATSTTAGGGTDVQVKLPQYVYNHETGYSAAGDAINAYIEASDQAMGDGDWAWSIYRIIPDIKFRSTSGGVDTVTVSIKGRDFPGDTLATIATAACISTTSQVQVRGRARQISLRAESTASGFGWRLGNTRIDARPDGRR